MKSLAVSRACLLALACLALAGCNYPGQSPVTPTLDVTQVYETVQARLTEAIALTPSLTPSPSPTTAPTATVSPTAAPTSAPSATPVPVTPTVRAGCDQASPGNPIDVTIPDDTQMQPGQAFSKTWRLRNTGTCTWTRDYAVVWFSGNSNTELGAPASVALQGTVAPGESIDVTVDMVAPLSPATYQSNWKLRNAAGVLFGIGGEPGLPFYVRIVVVRGPTASPTAVPSASVTPTPGPQASGPATLLPGDRIDLDSNQVNGGNEDLLYQRNDADGKHYLSPQGSATLSVYGGFKPSLSDCQNAGLGANPVAMEDLSAGTYLCYRTGLGLPGWARLTGFNPDNATLNLDIFTWDLP
jgi:hypothetical protein